MHNQLAVSMLVVASILLAPAQAFAEEGPGKSKSNGSEATAKTNKKGKVKITALESGRGLFDSHCASCHRGGGNSVKPSKPVKGSHVTSTLATFKSYLNQPVGTMPHYEHLIEDEKLLSNLYTYVKSLDDRGGEKTGKASGQ
jgi:mono/diheme cytochrome c family protein